MTTLAENLAKTWLGSLTAEELARADEVVRQAVRGMQWLYDGLQTLGTALRQGIENIEKNNEREELLKLYRRRHTWKKADIAKINTYRLSKVGHSRLARLAATTSRGRPTIVPYLPWFEKMDRVIRLYAELLAPDTKSHRRLFLLKHHRSWWPQFVEMTYRGEYERLKRAGVRGPADAAEHAVANACAISVSYVRLLCGEVRKDMVRLNYDRTSCSMTVAQFETWKRTGRPPGMVI